MGLRWGDEKFLTMLNKPFIVSVSILALAFIGLIIYNKLMTPIEPLIGTQHTSLGNKHIGQDQTPEQYNSNPASSGDHYADSSSPANWGIYSSEIKQEIYLHNLEHGGILITYNPDRINDNDLKKLEELFAPPYDNKDFKPAKFIIMPRSKNTSTIQLAAWTYTLDLNSFDSGSIQKFYKQHSGKSPEPLAGPMNMPAYF